VVKGFKTYDMQIEYLRKEKNIICDTLNDRDILVKYGYFNVVNGYKMPFVASKDENGNHTYVKGVRIADILEVKLFDDELRHVLFKNITKVEAEVRTVAAYAFDLSNEKDNKNWQDNSAYDDEYFEVKKIVEVVKSLMSEVSTSRSNYLRHYQEKHSTIPTWILVKVINFNTFIDFLNITRKDVKDSICDLYGLKNRKDYSDYKLLQGSLHWIRKIRNACGHNERVYDMQMGGRIDLKYFDTLPKTYSVKRGQNKTMLDLLVYMRYYLSDDDYIRMLEEIEGLLRGLEEKIEKYAFEIIRSKMGIKSLGHFEEFKKLKKEIKYCDFC
jgi:abortive infection bacteriophage resistance protein